MPIDAYNYDSNIRKELAIAGMTVLEDTFVTKNFRWRVQAFIYHPEYAFETAASDYG